MSKLDLIKPHSAFYINDALKYRSARREFVIDKIYNYCHQFRTDTEVNKKAILLAMEYFHSSASIIDDIQDCETERKGIPAYYIRNNYGTAAFASLNLWHYGIEILSDKYDLNQVLRILRNLINTQEIDVGLYSDKTGDVLHNYFNFSSLKISYELELIYYLSCPNHYKLKDERSLNILKEIGRLIQFIDDESDELINFISTIKIKSEPFNFNLSLPIVLATKYSNMPKEYIHNNIYKPDAIDVYNKYIDTEIVREKTKAIINNKFKEIKLEISKIEDFDTSYLSEFAESVYSESFLKNNVSHEIII